MNTSDKTRTDFISLHLAKGYISKLESIKRRLSLKARPQTIEYLIDYYNRSADDYEKELIRLESEKRKAEQEINRFNVEIEALIRKREEKLLQLKLDQEEDQKKLQAIMETIKIMKAGTKTSNGIKSWSYQDAMDHVKRICKHESASLVTLTEFVKKEYHNV